MPASGESLLVTIVIAGRNGPRWPLSSIEKGGISILGDRFMSRWELRKAGWVVGKKPDLLGSGNLRGVGDGKSP